MSEDDRLEKAIDALSQDTSKMSSAARIRKLLPKIEAAIAAGHSRENIYEAMRKEGLPISSTGFVSALARARRNQGGKAKAPAPSPKPESAPPKESNPNPLTEPKGFEWNTKNHKPENLI
ncbi:MAG: TraK family protein [Betaproteobacteria bacterium]|nr:TraK family protein [Betaproteobacteria bacterium]